jgi:dipeptidyl aminopeptidase/acylaminoacyl peptidase
VLYPDITYETNEPGMSAVWAVVPAVKAAIATGIVDPNRVGLTGHSWGGYQTAHLVTQTNIFKAAVAGAPLTNMISMYGSIYGGAGIADGAIFEASQGRFDGGPWGSRLAAYERNSPVLHADKVTTPLIIMHNDKDGAVNWNQAIEYFHALRRNNKNVIMLQYPGEDHNLRDPKNQKDYSRRMREFFDHYLKGAPAPRWIREGVQYIEMDDYLKGRDR